MLSINSYDDGKKQNNMHFIQIFFLKIEDTTLISVFSLYLILYLAPSPSPPPPPPLPPILLPSFPSFPFSSSLPSFSSFLY